MPKTPLLEQDVPLSMETIKKNFQHNDFSTKVSEVSTMRMQMNVAYMPR